MTAPGIVTTAILCLVFSWNDYAFAVTFAGPGSQTLPVAASQLITQTGVDWGRTAIGTWSRSRWSSSASPSDATW